MFVWFVSFLCPIITQELLDRFTKTCRLGNPVEPHECYISKLSGLTFIGKVKISMQSWVPRIV